VSRDGYRLRDAASVASYGLHRGLNLNDGVGRKEFASAHDPVPAAARPDPMAHGLTGDPFDDPARPLVLTLASDCADLPEVVLRDLLALSRFPGIVISIAPGIPDLGYDGPLRLAWIDDEPVIHITQTASEAGALGDLFANFDSRAPSRIRKPRDHASAFAQPGLIERAGEIFDAPKVRAQVVAKEAIAHKALGNDYIVSGILVRGRGMREAGWPNELGACTADEAFALAGLKSRMYRTVPLSAEPDGLVMESTALYRDLAVTRLIPRLRGAIGSALGPHAFEDEAACVDRLLAVRSRLSDLLIERDWVLRLARRDALGPDWAGPFDQGPVSGEMGNELTAHLAYHTMAGLNTLTAIADNLTWIARRRSGIAVSENDTSSSFAQMMTKWKRDQMTASLLGTVVRLDNAPVTPLVLALLRLRNAVAHRDGIDFGILSTQTMTIPATREVAALWFDRRVVGPKVRLGGDEIDLYKTLASHARFNTDMQLAAMTFPDFSRSIAKAAFDLTTQVLSWPPWRSPRTWLFRSDAYRQRRSMQGLWRANLHRRLLDL
jgi:hypothetical protein